MSSQFYVVYTVPSNAQTVKDKLRLYGGNGIVPAPSQIERVASYTNAISGGTYNGKLEVVTTAVAASGTVTIASADAGDTVTVGVTVFTGSDTATLTTQWLTGVSDTLQAASLASSINANATTKKFVTATSALGVVTITTIVPGVVGNFIPLAQTSSDSEIVVSGTTLASGAEDAHVVLRNGV